VLVEHGCSPPLHQWPTLASSPSRPFPLLVVLGLADDSMRRCGPAIVLRVMLVVGVMSRVLLRVVSAAFSTTVRCGQVDHTRLVPGSSMSPTCSLTYSLCSSPAQLRVPVRLRVTLVPLWWSASWR
jgi:hypothetical protein